MAEEVDWRTVLKQAVYGTSTAGDANTPEQFAEAIRAERGAFRERIAFLEAQAGMDEVAFRQIATGCACSRKTKACVEDLVILAQERLEAREKESP